MKYLLIYFLVLNSCKTTQTNSDVTNRSQETTFEVILESVTDGKNEQSLEVIDTALKLEDVYSQINISIQPKHQIPEVDFNNQVIAALFLGEKNTGGYHIVPVEVVNEDDKTIIHYKEVTPGPRDMVTMSLTQPFCIIKILNPKKEIVFNKLK